MPEAPQSPACTRHFCVHWVAEGIDAPNLDRRATATASPTTSSGCRRSPNTSTRSRTTSSAGATQSRRRARAGGSGKTDIYLAQIGGALFGYAAPDRGQATQGRTACRAACTATWSSTTTTTRFEFPGTTPLDDLEVTFAHEYNHILQFGYDAYQDAWFAESTAVWMEDQVYNGINDYLRYVRRWVNRCDTPLTANSIKEYGSAVWNEWLAHRYGRSIVRQAWARAIHTQARRLLRRRLRIGDPRRRRLRLRPRLRPLRPRRRRVAHRPGLPRGRALPGRPAPGHACRSTGARCDRALNHTTFELLRVHAERRTRRSSSTPWRRTAIAAGLALVGRIGSERHGRVVIAPRLQAAAGAAMTVRLADPGRFDRITAVLVNADTSGPGLQRPPPRLALPADEVPFDVERTSVR